MNYDNNLNYDDEEEEVGFCFKNVIISTLIIIFIVLGIWFFCAIRYRYSNERVSEKLRKKYKNSIEKTQTLLASDGKVNDDKTQATAVMTIQNKDIEGSDSKSKIFTLPIKDCSPFDYTCVEL